MSAHPAVGHSSSACRIWDGSRRARIVVLPAARVHGPDPMATERVDESSGKLGAWAILTDHDDASWSSLHRVGHPWGLAEAAASQGAVAVARQRPHERLEQVVKR